MREFFVVIVFFVFVLGYSALSFGQELEEQYYNFDDMLIDGSYRDPQGMFERSRSESQFEGMVRLRRSFLEEVKESCSESNFQP